MISTIIECSAWQTSTAGDQAMSDKLVKAVVDRYISEFRPAARYELNIFKKMPSLKMAVSEAALCKLDAKRHPHQRRLPKVALIEAQRRLFRMNLSKCSSFEELHERVR